MELLNSGTFALSAEMIDMSGILSDQSAVLLALHSSKTVSFAGVAKTAVKTFHQNFVSFLETRLLEYIVGSVVEFAVLLLVAGILNVVGAVGSSEVRYVAMKSV